MVEQRHDQAEGLRRMFHRRGGHTVAVFAGSRGTGATTCVLNVAAAVAHQGRRVVAVDENREAAISRLLELRPRYDFQDVIEGRCGLAQALVHTPGGLTVVTAGDAARPALHSDRPAKERMLRWFRKLNEAADLVLVDARSDTDEPSAFAAAADDIVIVVSTTSRSITGGYTQIKRMNRTHGRKRFHVLVNCADDEGVAQHIQANMARAARKHLGVDLDYIGAIPRDPAVAKSGRFFMSALGVPPRAETHQHLDIQAAAAPGSSAQQNYFTRLDNFMQRAIHGNFAVGAGV